MTFIDSVMLTKYGVYATKTNLRTSEQRDAQENEHKLTDTGFKKRIL